jgi:hypothetical protein
MVGAKGFAGGAPVGGAFVPLGTKGDGCLEVSKLGVGVDVVPGKLPLNIEGGSDIVVSFPDAFAPESAGGWWADVEAFVPKEKVGGAVLAGSAFGSCTNKLPSCETGVDALGKPLVMPDWVLGLKGSAAGGFGFVAAVGG